MHDPARQHATAQFYAEQINKGCEVSKIKKLIRNPNLFMRDYFLKRSPLFAQADINRITSIDEKSASKNVSSKSGLTKIIRKGVVKTVTSGILSFSHKVDIVITWVDGDDPEFIRARTEHERIARAVKVAANNAARYQTRDELRFTIRSILTYAPWVGNIFIVTNGQVPYWFNSKQDRVRIVKHADIIEARYLPTFNSHVIESCLHRISGLSERYVYFNDDVMLLRRVDPTDFFTESGLMRGFISSATLPNGPVHDGDTPSMAAAKNARRGVFNETGYFFDKKFAHTYHPQRKSIAEECETRFEDVMQICRANRFRSDSDILCTSFLYPCYAYATGRGVFSTVRAWYFNIRDVSAKSFYASLLSFRGNASGPVSVCLNDHLPDDGKFNYPDYESGLKEFLSAYFPEKFEFENEERTEEGTLILDRCEFQLVSN